MNEFSMNISSLLKVDDIEKKLKFGDIFKKKSSYLSQLHESMQITTKFSADNLNVFAPVQIQNAQKNQL